MNTRYGPNAPQRTKEAAERGQRLAEKLFSQRPPPRWINARFLLWAHLVSEHATILDIDFPMDALVEMHDHEHAGPGTIRNHPKEDRSYSLKRLGEVLSEAEE